jgi:hypothetical protein
MNKKVSMNKMSKLTWSLILFSCLWIQGCVSGPHPDEKSSAQNNLDAAKYALDDSGRIIRKPVRVTGVGLTPQEATQDGLMKAVRNVVGQLIMQERIVEDDQIVLDQILMLSDGFVEEYKDLRRWDEEGAYYVELEALVRQGELLSRIEQENLPVSEYVDSEKLWAQAYTQGKKYENVEAWLRELSKDDYRRYSVRLMQPMEKIDLNELTEEHLSETPHWLRLKIEVLTDFSYYNEVYIPRAHRILSKIATEVDVITARRSTAPEGILYAEIYLDFKGDVRYLYLVGEKGRWDIDRGNNILKSFNRHFYAVSDELQTSSEWVHLITGGESQQTIYQYKMPPYYFKLLSSIATENQRNREESYMVVGISFRKDNTVEIARILTPIDSKSITNSKGLRLTQNHGSLFKAVSLIPYKQRAKFYFRRGEIYSFWDEWRTEFVIDIPFDSAEDIKAIRGLNLSAGIHPKTEENSR